MRRYDVIIDGNKTTLLLSDSDAAARGLTPQPAAAPAPAVTAEPAPAPTKAKVPANKTRKPAANKQA